MVNNGMETQAQTSWCYCCNGVVQTDKHLKYPRFLWQEEKNTGCLWGWKSKDTQKIRKDLVISGWNMSSQQKTPKKAFPEWVKSTGAQRKEADDFYLIIHRTGKAIMRVVHAIFTCVFQKRCWQIEKCDELLPLISLKLNKYSLPEKMWTGDLKMAYEHYKGRRFLRALKRTLQTPMSNASS